MRTLCRWQMIWNSEAFDLWQTDVHWDPVEQIVLAKYAMQFLYGLGTLKIESSKWGLLRHVLMWVHAGKELLLNEPDACFRRPNHRCVVLL